MLYPDDFIEKQFCFISTIGGEKISLKNSNIAIYDKDGNLKHQSSCYRLLAIFVIGHISITTCLIEKAKKFGFVIILMTSGFRPYQVIGAMAEANVELRKNQYLYCDFDCAKKLIANKISNQRNLLMSIRNKSVSQLQAIQNIDNYVNNLLSANSIRQIMGIEGSVARIYFKFFFDNVNWNGRFPRVKTDMINALLDIGYTLLFNFIDALLSIFGFDRYCGFCHTQFYMRKSLTCDIVEPFRCIIDKQIKKSINLGQFKEEDFKQINYKWLLKIEKNTEYIKIFVTAILKYKKEIYTYIRAVYKAFMKKEYSDKFPTWKWEG